MAALEANWTEYEASAGASTGHAPLGEDFLVVSRMLMGVG